MVLLQKSYHGRYLQKISTSKTGLQRSRMFTVLPKSADILVEGQREWNVDWTLTQYTPQAGRPQISRQLGRTCKHEYPDDLLGLLLEKQEYLAVSCRECKDIKLINLLTSKISVAFHSDMSCDTMCVGKPDRIWVWCWGDYTVKELNCTTTTFAETGRKIISRNPCWSLCYLSAPHRAVALTHFHSIEAVSYETGEQLWQLSKIDGKMVEPHGVAFSTEEQVILLADGFHRTIVLLDPGTGSAMQMFDLPMSSPWNVLWGQNHLFLHHSGRHGWYITKFKLGTISAKGCVFHLYLTVFHYFILAMTKTTYWI